MLACPETDLQLQRAIVAEQRLRVDGAGFGHAEGGQGFLDQGGLALAKLVALAAAIQAADGDGIVHGRRP